MSDSHDAHGHGHGEAVYPYTPHHFHSAKQHLESGKMGVWLFLVTEILFFAGLCCA
jgi:cytochrome c oxidase subunit 3